MKKSVMTRAWEIFRSLVGDRIAKLSQALKMAWAEIKNAAKKVVTPFTDGEEVEVECYYYVGAGFTRTCLEAKYNDGVLTLDYAHVSEWGERKAPKKRCEVKITVEHGLISDGRNVRFVNLDLENECIKEITGKTYDVKSAIKEHGFKWNKASQSWCR